jgi:hypothetical protein
MSVLMAVTCTGVGEVGVGVPAADVATFGNPAVKFVPAKLNGPPKAPAVVFCNAKVGALGVLVNVHTILAKVRKLTTGIVTVLPANVPKLAGLPDVAALVSVHVAPERSKFALAASVNVTGVLIEVTVV